MSFKEDLGGHLMGTPGFSTPLLIDTLIRKQLSELTERELEITALLARGLNSREIAEELSLSEHTVATHRKQIIKKSGCRNSTHLVAICLRLGLI